MEEEKNVIRISSVLSKIDEEIKQLEEKLSNIKEIRIKIYQEFEQLLDKITEVIK